jgi:hypothetical protein
MKHDDRQTVRHVLPAICSFRALCISSHCQHLEEWAPVLYEPPHWHLVLMLYVLCIVYTRAVWKVRGLAAGRRCYTEGGGAICQVVVGGLRNGGVIFIPLTVVRVWVTVVLKEPFLGWRSNYEGRLKSSWTHLITPNRNFVEVRWRSLFGRTPLARDALFKTLHPLLENVNGVIRWVHESFKRPS